MSTRKISDGRLLAMAAHYARVATEEVPDADNAAQETWKLSYSLGRLDDADRELIIQLSKEYVKVF